MVVSRIELADATSPERLVLEILRHEPSLSIPVPIEALCEKLDIIGIEALTTDGYEGGLLTQRDKRNGIVLVNNQSPRKRRRFTIAHELGHFLMPSHVPDENGAFLCAQADMFSLSKDEVDRRLRMEAEANRFASNILLPAPTFRKDVARSKMPNLIHVSQLSDTYDVSREALGRAYITFRQEEVALIVTHNNRVLRYYKGRDRFPFIDVPFGAPVPAASLLMRRAHEVGTPSDIDETDAGVWIDVRRGERAPIMFEQVHMQSGGYALIMLSLASVEDDSDPDENRTSKERYRERQARFSN